MRHNPAYGIMSKLVSDREALPRRDRAFFDRDDGAVTVSDDSRFAAVERSEADFSARIPGDRFEIDLSRRFDAKFDQ